MILLRRVIGGAAAFSLLILFTLGMLYGMAHDHNRPAPDLATALIQSATLVAYSLGICAVIVGLIMLAFWGLEKESK